MFQLSGLDNLMVAGELPNIPMHMSAIMIYETRGKRGATRLVKAFPERFEHFMPSLSIERGRYGKLWSLKALIVWRGCPGVVQRCL
jgi:hypothetical protein